MFQRLLTADLVVADLSIHNANVFYELGIRHALRGKRTFLLRSAQDAYPFDLQTDRYLTYDNDDPAASLDRPDRGPAPDPGLRGSGQPGLPLAAGPSGTGAIRAFPRRPPGLPRRGRSAAGEPEQGRPRDARGGGGRLRVGERGIAHRGSRPVQPQGVRRGARPPGNRSADRFRRPRGQPAAGNDLRAPGRPHAVRPGPAARPGPAKGSSRAIRAEAHALLGRNAKTRWKGDWSAEPEPARDGARRPCAPPFLEESYEAYRAGLRAPT